MIFGGYEERETALQLDIVTQLVDRGRSALGVDAAGCRGDHANGLVACHHETMRNMRYVFMGATLLAIACSPAPTCACSPAVTTLIVYGAVRTTDGAPVPGAALGFELSGPLAASPIGGSCSLDPRTAEPLPYRALADGLGNFHTVLYSYFGSSARCLRASAIRGNSTATSDTVVHEGVRVTFRAGRPDSLELLFTFP